MATNAYPCRERAIKQPPKYALQFRWGDFQLNIIGPRAILWWGGLFGALIGIKIYGTKILDLL